MIQITNSTTQLNFVRYLTKIMQNNITRTISHKSLKVKISLALPSGLLHFCSYYLLFLYFRFGLTFGSQIFLEYLGKYAFSHIIVYRQVY